MLSPQSAANGTRGAFTAGAGPRAATSADPAETPPPAPGPVSATGPQTHEAISGRRKGILALVGAPNLGGDRRRRLALAFLVTTAGALFASALISAVYLFYFRDPSRIVTEIVMTSAITYIVGLPIALYVIRLTTRVGAAERARIQAEARRNESELARMEAERAHRSARAADRMRMEFLARMSHEVRTPINGILGMAEVLKYTNLNEDQKFYISTIAASGQSLLTLVNDAIEVSSFEADRMTLREEPFDPHILFESVAKRIVEARRNDAVSFHLAISPDLPRTLIGDRARLRQVAANLIDNALRFTAEGAVRVFVDAAPAPSESASLQRPASGTEEREADGGGDEEADAVILRLTVADTGPGVSAADQQTIFEMFHQLDGSASRTHQGTGLGLTIVASIAEVMKGEVSVESEPGAGAVFRFEAPLRTADAAMRAAPLAGARMVVVSSDDGERAALTETLAAAGADVMASADFPATRRALRAGAVRAALIDWRRGDEAEATALIDLCDRVGTPALVRGAPPEIAARPHRSVRHLAPEDGDLAAALASAIRERPTTPAPGAEASVEATAGYAPAEAIAAARAKASFNRADGGADAADGGDGAIPQAATGAAIGAVKGTGAEPEAGSTVQRRAPPGV